MKRLFKFALVLILPLVFLMACSTSSKSSAKSDKTAASSQKKEEFKPEDTSNKTIRKIKTYGDYIIMAKKIYDDGYAGYEEKYAKAYPEGTAETITDSAAVVRDMITDQLINFPEKEYGNKKDQEISAQDREPLLNTLYSMRDLIKDDMVSMDRMIERKSK